MIGRNSSEGRNDQLKLLLSQPPTLASEQRGSGGQERGGVINDIKK